MEEKSGENGVLFYTNTEGFPLTDSVWQRMFAHAGRISQSDSVSTIKNTSYPPPVQIPKAPLNLPIDMSIHEKIETIQQYMRDLQYNHTGTQFFDIKKYRPVYGLIDTAKEIVRESLPIKCLEAVILGIYLTNGIPGLSRFPIGFRTQFGKNVHRHVVLGLSWFGKFGAIGMSRREDLMYKPLEFSSLGSLIVDFMESYNQYWHSVKKIKVGYPISHDPLSCEPIHWKGTTIAPTKMSRLEIEQEFEKHMKSVKAWAKCSPMGCYAPRSPAPATFKHHLERKHTDLDRARLPSRSLEKDFHSRSLSEKPLLGTKESLEVKDKDAMPRSSLGNYDIRI